MARTRRNRKDDKPKVQRLEAKTENQKEYIRSIIEKLTEQHPKDGAPILDIIESAKEKGIDETQTEHMIKKMSENGEIYQPSAGHYKLLKGR